MYQRRLPPLGSLRAFEVAARHQSIVAAATELNVTHGAISKQIQLLEQELGTALFERRNRGIHLTRSGRWLAERLESVFSDLDRTMRDFRREDAAPAPLTVSCEPTLCLRMLIPALTELKSATGLDVRVLAAGGYIDIERGHVDVAIRRSDVEMPAANNITMLVRELMGPVMMPSLAKEAHDALPCLHSDTRPSAWKNWSQQTDIVMTGQSINYEHFYLAIQAAEAGQGMAMASLHMVADALTAGRLCAPYGFTPDGTSYYAIQPSGIVDERSNIFIAWLKQQMVCGEHISKYSSKKC
jgi:LysR family transcriptional regulator, glycine cleavage system transcriptional activator